MQLHIKTQAANKIGPMKNKLDTLQMVMLGYLMSIMAALYKLTKEHSWCAKERTGTHNQSYCDHGMSPGLQ